MRVSKWGNSLGIRLPAVVVKILDLKEGDDIVVTVAGQSALEVTLKPTSADLIARLRDHQGMVPADFKFDRLEANERQ